MAFPDYGAPKQNNFAGMLDGSYWTNNLMPSANDLMFGQSASPSFNPMDVPVIDKSTFASADRLRELGLDATGNPIKTDSLSLGQKFGVGLGALQTLGGLYLGYNQLKLGQKSLANDIRSFNANYNAQRDLTNAAMYDRNVRRNLELGQSMPEAKTTAQQYVDARGIKALSDKAG